MRGVTTQASIAQVRHSSATSIAKHSGGARTPLLSAMPSPVWIRLSTVCRPAANPAVRHIRRSPIQAAPSAEMERHICERRASTSTALSTEMSLVG